MQEFQEKCLTLHSKALKSSKSDNAAIAYVDICKASTYVSKEDHSALRFLVPSIENDLAVWVSLPLPPLFSSIGIVLGTHLSPRLCSLPKLLVNHACLPPQALLLNPTKPFVNSDGEVDEDILVNALVSFYRLNTRTGIHHFQTLLNKNISCPASYTLALLKALNRIASEVGFMTGCMSSQERESSFGVECSRLFPLPLPPRFTLVLVGLFHPPSLPGCIAVLEPAAFARLPVHFPAVERLVQGALFLLFFPRELDFSITH